MPVITTQIQSESAWIADAESGCIAGVVTQICLAFFAEGANSDANDGVYKYDSTGHASRFQAASRQAVIAR
jgi:hypothetical protein